MVVRRYEVDAVIINFEKLKQEHSEYLSLQKKQLIFECQQEISKTEEQIQLLIAQINELQSNIDFNARLIAKMKQ